MLLHLHGKKIYFEKLATLPVQAINWHDRLTEPTLQEGKGHFGGAVVGGLSEWQTLRGGSLEEVIAETRDAIAQTEASGVIVAPGCVLPLDVSDAHLDAVVRTVKSAVAA
jgi:uroporphyrinogen decarboxylase